MNLEILEKYVKNGKIRKSEDKDLVQYNYSDYIVALKIYGLFKKKDRIDFKYIKDNVDDSMSKIKRNLILLQDKKLIKKHGVTNGSWYSKEEMS